MPRKFLRGFVCWILKVLPFFLLLVLCPFFLLLMLRPFFANVFDRNDAISLMFHKLAKLHQECALRHNDEFRALTNNLISGRVKFLDFEITPDNLDRVKKIKGIGESSVGKLKEFFDRRDGSCNRIEEFEKDEQRMAVRTMKNIWGVGISKVSELCLSCIIRCWKRHCLNINNINLCCRPKI